jgi:mannitol PTS system EIICBA or EIICB component
MAQSIQSTDIKTIIFACEAGMGSSLMSVNMLKKKLATAKIDNITVVHMPAREIPPTAQIVVVHQSLADVVRTKSPNAVVCTFKLFMNDPIFDQLVQAIVGKKEIKAS